MTTASAGRLMTITVNTSGTTWDTLPALRSKTFTINGSPVDITNSDSAGWTELLGGEGVRNATFQAGGVIDHDTTEKALMGQLFDYRLGNTLKSYKIFVNGLGTFAGTFFLTEVSEAGNHDGEVTYSIGGTSSGAISYTAVS
ncbi:phage major tail protein, TP901-1 family [Asticcacaulis biprosthecium C19]|uniref:Phage major tail protein, TP901-1 family n=1 Tax=Asticcacaulis biprosthecium C19 TaxID=715226 RepID=F4QGZ1_9CAUL|nr:phage major tail protein, TP901-1 family [Asticcacaulis biprosthecium]EGF93744.1 phage major tail protein, TP901-1 family [Asticcacaulis biprosthecium C19]